MPPLLLLKSSCLSSSDDASVVVVYSLGPSLSPRRFRHCLQYLRHVVYSSSYADASVFVADSSGRLPLPTPPLSSSSIPWVLKHTAASAVGDVHSGGLYLILPPPTPTSFSSSPWAHLPLPTTPSLSPIPQTHNRDAAASAAVPESSSPPSLSLIPRTCRLFLVLCQRLRRFH